VGASMPELSCSPSQSSRESKHYPPEENEKHNKEMT